MTEPVVVARLRARIHGRVQGVFYRQSASRVARGLSLHGRVRNCADGTVELIAEGARSGCEQLLLWCETGPPAAGVTSVDATWLEGTGEFTDFTIGY